MNLTCKTLLAFAVLSLLSWRAETVFARQFYGVPVEFEAAGEDAMGVLNSGVGLSHGSAAVNINPALLGLIKEYRANIAYFWPQTGREFYQVGVVDGTTAKLVAGAVYTGFSETYKFGQQSKDLDSPVGRRISVGIAYPFTHFMLGLSGHYVEAQKEEQLVLKPYKGISLGVGFLALLTEQIRFGLSYQNFNNSKTKDVAAGVARAGISWVPKSGEVELFLDYRQKLKASLEEVGMENDLSAIVTQKGDEYLEKMLQTGARIRVYNVLQLGLGYGQQLGSEKREELSGQIGLSHKEFSLSYAMMRSTQAQKTWHGSMNVSVLFNM